MHRAIYLLSYSLDVSFVWYISLINIITFLSSDCGLRVIRILLFERRYYNQCQTLYAQVANHLQQPINLQRYGGLLMYSRT